MSLFQNSVLNKYLKGLESEKVNQAYDRFTSHFHNPTIQENIRNSKEEQYQGEFLIDLFVNVFGYIKNPTPDFNLTTELKNIKGSKKTDGAILKGEKALAVIELKGTNTTDLSKVETQAFGYKNNQPGCNYVITSNFEKLRFYIDNAVDFEEFNLFQLTKERFELLWLCLSSEYLLKDIPKKIKDESVTQEENVTKKLYKDYAAFRNEIFDAIQNENRQYDKLTLFKKTQKLLDRFLFIFFAEDRLLLPPNSIRSIINQWTDLRDKYDEYFPLYDRFKKYFGYMNTGHKGQQHDIFAYNGGLFAPDDILDTIKINDDLLYKHTVNLSNYDFESEVSVNILGHIFEHSLNDIDEIQAEIQGITTEQSKTKRKKDGVFYTPKYITKYIVDNTVGKLCEEKKIELDIQEAEYEKERKGRQKATIKKLSQKLEEYRTWLLQITICDPACGSGAFLNQALEFLIAEHQYIDELQAKLFGDAMILSEVENAILENNLFGVDINEESVEIAKLSLWLRTAQKGRKLTSLNNNIKCGNSLIDDPAVAGDKAFNWQTEFPDVFKETIKNAYHLVFTTHNSRTSKRMIDYGIKKGPALELNLKEEVALTKIFRDIVLENNYNIMANNICKDHVHLILVCEPEALHTIAKTLKGKSSYIYQSQGFKPLGEPLWSQKFFFAQLDEFVFADLAKAPGYVFTDSYLDTAINYIESNRSKHHLPQSDTLKNTIADFTKTKEDAFAPEYTGGFDVVIGNPPYVQISEFQDYYSENYSTAKCGDLYAIFYEKGVDILKTEGAFSYITPSLFIKGIRYEALRFFLLENTEILQIDDKGDGVFTDVQMPTAIFVALKNKLSNQDWSKYIPGEKITSRMLKNSSHLEEYSLIKRGLEIGKNKVHPNNINKVKIITGEDVERYGIKSYQSIESQIYNEYKKDNKFFESKRIVIRETGNRITSLLVNENVQQNRSLYSILLNKKEYKYEYFLALINSKLMQFYYKSNFAANTEVFPKIRIAQVKKLPIKLSENNLQNILIDYVKQICSIKVEFEKLNFTLNSLLSTKFYITSNRKLQNWHDLDFGEFSKELEKARKTASKENETEYKKLSLSEEAEWMLYFNEQKEKAQTLKAEINKTDQEIDAMVYELYGLTEEEIAIVEEATA